MTTFDKGKLTLLC